MQWNSNLSHYLTTLILKEWERSKVAILKDSSDNIAKEVHSLLNQDLQREKALEKEVEQMLDTLEKTHTGHFERYKMQALLKKKLAEKKGIIL